MEIDIDGAWKRLTYDPDTGEFRWRANNRGPARAGSLAGSSAPQGYWRVKLDQKAYLAHRLAWAMYYHEQPPAEIDHRNGVRTDNRISNLREATRLQNCQNVSGRGVRFEASRGKWLARICVNYKQINLGRYATEEEARAVYLEACRTHFGEFANER